MGDYGGYMHTPLIDLSMINPKTLLPYERSPGDGLPSADDLRALACDLALGAPCKAGAYYAPGNLWVKGGVYLACNVGVHFACQKILRKKKEKNANMCMKDEG
jgi:hypothetical protein